VLVLIGHIGILAVISYTVERACPNVKFVCKISSVYLIVLQMII